MKKTTIALLVLIVLCVAGAVIWYLFESHSSGLPSTNSSTQNSGTFPTGGLNGSVSDGGSTLGASSTQSTLTIHDQTGTVVINDFIHNEVTEEDPSNKGNYLVAGDFSCLTAAVECNNHPTNYTVYYNGGTQSFNVTLNTEPIGSVRLEAEAFLMSTLGLTQTKMCNLNYFVSVRSQVNDQYSAKNLGFSFCPGATVLPK